MILLQVDFSAKPKGNQTMNENCYELLIGILQLVCITRTKINSTIISNKHFIIEFIFNNKNYYATANFKWNTTLMQILLNGVSTMSELLDVHAFNSIQIGNLLRRQH